MMNDKIGGGTMWVSHRRVGRDVTDIGILAYSHVEAAWTPLSWITQTEKRKT
jgi:hypothetical protein